MDYSALLHVSDSVSGVKQTSVAAPKVSVSKETNPLDSMEVNSSPKTANKISKVIIIDDSQIERIMKSPREEKRKLLSRLTDSQRRRVLTRYRELTKVKDEESTKQVASGAPTKLDYVLLDNLVSNIVFSYSDTDIKNLKEWTDKFGTPEEIADFISALENKDQAGVEAGLENFKQFIAGKDVASSVRVSFDSPEVSELDDEATAEIEQDAATDASSFEDEHFADSIRNVSDATIAKHVLAKNLRYEDVERVYDAAFNKALSAIRTKLTDSANNKVNARRIMDEVLDEIAESTPLNDDGTKVEFDGDKLILEALSSALMSFVNGDASELEDLANLTVDGDVINEETLEEETGKDDSEDESADESNEESNDSEDESDASEDDSEEVEDLEEVEDSAIVDKATVRVEGPQREEVEFGEAEEHLDKVAEHEPSIEKKNQKALRELVNQIKEQSHATTEHNKTVFDCIALAKGIISKKVDNAIVDSLTPKVPALQKYNFRVSDCDECCCCPETCPATGVVNPPLTRDEYYTIAPIVPDFFPLIIASYPCPECPCVESYESNNGVITVNPNGISQNYYAYDTTPEDVCSILGCADSADWSKIINQHCVPASHAFHLAALTNNLSVIDSTFYKKHLNDSEWHFDTVPACLKGKVSGPGSIKLVTDASEATITLFGVNFKLN